MVEVVLSRWRHGTWLWFRSAGGQQFSHEQGRNSWGQGQVGQGEPSPAAVSALRPDPQRHTLRASASLGSPPMKSGGYDSAGWEESRCVCSLMRSGSAGLPAASPQREGLWLQSLMW